MYDWATAMYYLISHYFYKFPEMHTHIPFLSMNAHTYTVYEVYLAV